MRMSGMKALDSRIASRFADRYASESTATRRHEETHRQRLYDPAEVERVLMGVGFDVRTVQGYGEYTLPDGLVGFVARRV